MNESEQAMHSDLLRAANARALLENDLLKEALAAIEAEVVQVWGATPQRDKEGKEALWQLYKTAQKFRSLLTGYIETGKVAQAQLAHYEKQSKIRSLFRAG
jgi:hypothetical protein